MRKPFLILPVLLILLCCLIIPFVQADEVGQAVPFLPPHNVTGAYDFAQGNDFLEMNTNFPISSQDIVYPDWLFGMMIAFMMITIYFGLVFISKDPAPWVSVIACGIIVFGIGLAAAEMAPLVGYTEVFHQVVPLVSSNGATALNSTNTIYVNEIIVYTMGVWVSYACYGLAIGCGLILGIAGFLLQMKQAKLIADAEQAQKNRDAENYMNTEQSIHWRKKDRL